MVGHVLGVSPKLKDPGALELFTRNPGPGLKWTVFRAKMNGLQSYFDRQSRRSFESNDLTLRSTV